MPLRADGHATGRVVFVDGAGAHVRVVSRDRITAAIFENPGATGMPELHWDTDGRRAGWIHFSPCSEGIALGQAMHSSILDEDGEVVWTHVGAGLCDWTRTPDSIADRLRG